MVVTLSEILGSAPQRNGAKMIISQSGQWGTIGGGNLEYHAATEARNMLMQRKSAQAARVEKVSLGGDFSQCCGGAVTLVFQSYDVASLGLLSQLQGSQGEQLLLTPANGEAEAPQMLDSAALHTMLKPFQKEEELETFLVCPESSALILKYGGKLYMLEKTAETRIPLLLFGAGHVGQAVARAILPLSFSLCCFDSRERISFNSLPDNVQVNWNANVVAEAERAAPGSWVLVMTHDHGQDFDIVQAMLERNDFGHLGLIGSKTKFMRFQHRLRDAGIAQSAIDRVNCPIGLAGIRGKQPAIIAASVAAQLLVVRERMFRKAVDNANHSGN